MPAKPSTMSREEETAFRELIDPVVSTTKKVIHQRNDTIDEDIWTNSVKPWEI